MARGRGGYRKPDNPAPVSVPGSGARTDGGPGDRQPLRAATGQPYGERKELIDQQRGAPLAVAGSAGDGSRAAGGGGRAVPPQSVGPTAAQSVSDARSPFGPSMRPHEPGNLGVASADNMLPAKTMLRIMYQKRPSPWIAGLLDALPD